MTWSAHGWRWIHYQNMPIEQEREHLHKAVQVLTDLFGQTAHRLVYRAR